MEKICFLFGHRNAPYEIRPEIAEAVERHYREYEIRHFVVGQYGAFDSMAATAAKTVKGQYPNFFVFNDYISCTQEVFYLYIVYFNVWAMLTH